MEWISVKDKLPDKQPLGNQKPIIVATKEGRVLSITYTRLGFMNLYSYTDVVTHWMPLPKPPKE